MRITTTQQGIIAQQEFAKLLMLGSEGQIEVSSPMSDDERRDMETHIRGQFGHGVAFQVKSTTHRVRRGGRKASWISIRFAVPEARLISHPLFWYFLAYLDLEAMAFVDPVFLIPSAQLHEHASRSIKGGAWHISVHLSLDRHSNDQWHTYQASPHEVGRRVVQILEDLPLTLAVPAAEAAALTSQAGLTWVTRTPVPRRPGAP